MIKNVLQGLNNKPISYYKVYKEIAGSTVGGIMLSQLIYWFTAMNKDVIYKIDEDFVEELDLSDGEIRGGKALLKKLDFLHIDRGGVPAKTYYVIDWELLYIAIGEGNKRMIEKREKRANDKAEKAEKRSLESREIKVRQNQQNKTESSDSACSVDLTEQALVKIQDRFREVSRTHLLPKNTTESTSREVLKFLNKLLRTNYQDSEDLKIIISRNFTSEQIKQVIQKKYDDWIGTNMEKYLRPSTLFGKKFEEYLNLESEKDREQRKKNISILLNKIEISIKTIENKSLNLDNLKSLSVKNKKLFNDDEMSLINSYNSIDQLISLFKQKELWQDLLKRSLNAR